MSGPVAYSRGANTYDATPAQLVADTWADFLDAIDTDRGTAKGQQWIAAPFAVAPDDDHHRNGGTNGSFAKAIGRPHRCKRCVRPRRFIGLDVDDGLTPEAFAALVDHLQRYSGCVYTTASHTPQAPRCRVVLELDMPAPRADLIAATEAIRARIAEALKDYGPLPWDDACDKPEQPLYLPVKDSSMYRLEGEPLVLAEVLAERPTPPQATEPRAGNLAALPSATGPTRYALAALDSAVRKVATMPEGGRNELINREAYGLGGFVPSGQLDAATIEAALVRATEAAGWDEPERTRQKIIDGINAGSLAPRSDGLQAGIEPEDEPERHLVEVDIADAMHARVPVPEFVVEPLIPRGTATLLGAHGGAGKSTLALTWCAHVAAGIPWAGLYVEHGRALFVSLEDPGPVVLYRLQKIVREYGIDWVELTGRLRVLDGTDVDAALMTEINDHGSRTLAATPIMREVEEAAEGAQLIVVDNASDGFDANENDRRQVRQFVRRLAQIAKANGAGLVLLAHVDKIAAKFGSRGNSYSGSTAWHNSARSRLALVEDEESGGIVLAQEKLNLGRRADPLFLSWSDGGVLVPVEVNPEAQEQAAQQQADDDAVAVLEVLRLAAADKVNIPTARSGPRTTWHALAEFPELPAHLKAAKSGKARTDAALTALERTKKIVRQGYQTEHRKASERWTLAQTQRQKAA